jgi:hypothetical protein
MDTRITAVVLAAAIAGGGYAGWKFYSELGHLRIELANARQALEQAKTEARVAKEKAAAVEKELDEQKIAVVSLRAERDSARLLQQSAIRQSERLQQDLQLASRQIEYLRARAGVSATQALPQLAPQRPMIIQALPAPRPQGAAVAAPVPGQGYGGRQ